VLQGYLRTLGLERRAKPGGRLRDLMNAGSVSAIRAPTPTPEGAP
jgi:hypothetical protein